MLIIKIMRHCEEVSDQCLLDYLAIFQILGARKILTPLHDQNFHFSVLMKEVALTVIFRGSDPPSLNDSITPTWSNGDKQVECHIT